MSNVLVQAVYKNKTKVKKRMSSYFSLGSKKRHSLLSDPTFSLQKKRRSFTFYLVFACKTTLPATFPIAINRFHFSERIEFDAICRSACQYSTTRVTMYVDLNCADNKQRFSLHEHPCRNNRPSSKCVRIIRAEDVCVFN